MTQETLINFKIAGDWKYPSQSGYNPSFAKGFTTTAANGGLPRIRANYRSQPVPVSATYEFASEHELNVFYSFYYGAIESGAKRFIAMIDISGECKEYVCQLVNEPRASGWTGYYAAITLDMLVVPNIDVNDLAFQYQISSMYRSYDEFLAMASGLPEALDPMDYVTYVQPIP